MLFALLIPILILILAPLLILMWFQRPPDQIGYIRLPKRVIPKIIKSSLPPCKTTIYELGCGDARVLQQVLLAHPEAHGIGVEVNPIVALLAKWRLRHNQRARVRRENIMDYIYTDAGIVICYLNNPTMAALKPKFDAELAPGARVISCDFPLPGRKTDYTVTVGKPWQLGQKLYIYDY